MERIEVRYAGSRLQDKCTVWYCSIKQGRSFVPLSFGMTADILGVTVEVPVEIQGPSLGAALLAAKADGVFPSLALAAEKMATTKAVLTPDPAMASYYEGKYRRFQKLYQVLRLFFSNKP